VDADGVPAIYDCNRVDAAVGSGLPDPPYNGIDEDCRGDDDFDADDDGTRPAEYALPGEPIDCDDEDPRRFPGQPEIRSNGIDDDCDGWADNTGSLAGGACSAVPATGAWWLVGVIAIAGRRRRRTRA
jgi:MYXO-CTERM domain-containing protein